jgi:hypothetical protein
VLLELLLRGLVLHTCVFTSLLLLLPLLLQADDCERYMFFSRAALEFLLVMDRQPDVLHLHDWQSALVVSARGADCCVNLVMTRLDIYSHHGLCS